MTEGSRMVLTRRAAIVSGASLAVAARGARAADGGLVVMQSEAPRSMDPGDHTASFTTGVLEPMYEGLVLRGADLTLAPSLATSWRVEAGGTRWVFALREGVTFHDGTAFDADSVVVSMMRFLDPKRGLAAAGRVRVILESARALDARTVEFMLRQPYAGFLALLATGPCCIVSPKAEQAGTIGRAAVGTGPFRMVEWRSGEFVQQTRYDGYWGAAPALDSLRWTWSSEASVLSMALQTGEADVVSPLPPVFAASAGRDPGLKLLRGDGAAVFWVALNTTLKPLDDVRVRQALNFGTDRAALVKALLLGNGKAANSPLAPVAPGYDVALDPYPYDVAKAKGLLEAAGAGGFTINVAVQEQEANIAEALQGMWAKIGVTLNAQRMEAGVWTKAAFAPPEQKQAAMTGGVIASWSAGAFNPDLQLRPLYASASASPAGANLGFFSDPALDRLLDQASATLDDRQRAGLYGQAQQIVDAQAPDVLLYYKTDLAATKADIAGVWVLPGGVVEVKSASRV